LTDPLTLIAAAGVIAIAAFAQGVTGFGHALIAIGPLAWFFGPREAVLVLTLLAPPISLIVLWRLRRTGPLKEVLALSLPLVFAGMPLGLALFGSIPEAALARAVGAILIASSVYFLSPWAPRPRARPLWVTVLAGFLSGFLNGLASTGGPPLVLYLHARSLGKDDRLAVMQSVFAAGSIAKVVAVMPQGFLHGGTWLAAGVMLLPLLAGVAGGHALYRRLPAERIRLLALLLLLAMGLSLFF
jgi:hypothetical protein